MKKILHNIAHTIGMYRSEEREVGGRGGWGLAYRCCKCGRWSDTISLLDSFIN